MSINPTIVTLNPDKTDGKVIVNSAGEKWKIDTKTGCEWLDITKHAAELASDGEGPEFKVNEPLPTEDKICKINIVNEDNSKSATFTVKYDFEDQNQDVYCKSDLPSKKGINVRNTGEANGNLLFSIPYTKQAKIIDSNADCKDTDKWSNTLWCEIDYGGKNGFVRTDLCKYGL